MTNTATVQVDLPAEVIAQLIAASQNAKAQTVDQKYVVTSEFADVPKAVAKPLVDAVTEKQAAYEAAKAELEGAKDAVRELMDGAEVLRYAETEQMVVESRVTVGQVLDTAKFKKAHPEIAAQFLRDRYSRNFRLL